MNARSLDEIASEVEQKIISGEIGWCSDVQNLIALGQNARDFKKNPVPVDKEWTERTINGVIDLHITGGCKKCTQMFNQSQWLAGHKATKERPSIGGQR